MTAEIASIRTASEAAAALRSTTPTDLAGLDPRTLAAVTNMLRAAADLARAQRPIVLHGPEAHAPAVAPNTAAYGAHVRIPAPPDFHFNSSSAITNEPRAWRSALWGDKVLWFGCGLAMGGVVGALVATVVGAPWVLVLSAVGAVLCPIGGAAINRAEHAARGRS